MKIERIPMETVTVEEFAEKHDLTMVVKERNTQFYKLSKFYAYFKDAEVGESGCLRGAFGNGKTEVEAIADYAKQISGEKLIIDAFKPSRREIQVPILKEYSGK